MPLKQLLFSSMKSFLKISQETILRRNLEWEKSRLKAFHDMHLSGVEQSHKDELGIFLDIKQNPTLDEEKIFHGANQAIISMTKWWKAMLERVI